MVRCEVNAFHFVFVQALRQFVPSLHSLVANNGTRLGGLAGNDEERKKDLEGGINMALETDLGANSAIVAEAVQEILRKLFGNPIRCTHPCEPTTVP